MRYLVNLTSDVLLFLRGGSLGKFSRSLGKTTHLSTWIHGDAFEILVSGTHVIILSEGRISKVNISDESFGAVEWSTPRSSQPLAVSLTPDNDVVTHGLKSTNLVKEIFNGSTGGIIFAGFEKENVSGIDKLYAKDNVIVYAAKTSEKQIALNYLGTESWEAVYETFGDVQSGSLRLEVLDNQSYILLGYNELTETGGWDPRVMMIDSNGTALWTKNNVFSTELTDRVAGVTSDPLSPDMFLVYTSTGDLINLVRITKATGSVVYNTPIPPLSTLFGGSSPQIISAKVDYSSNKLLVLFSSGDVFSGLTSGHSGTFYGLIQFSISEPTTTNAVPLGISATGLPDFVFDPEIASYSYTIPNTSSSVGFTVTNAPGQTTVIRVNGFLVDRSSFSVPVGPTKFEIVTSVGSYESVYTITITRAASITGPTYVDLTNGLAVGRGTVIQPMKNLNHAVKLVNNPLILRTRDFLPLSPDRTFEVTPVKSNDMISRMVGMNAVRLKNPSSQRIYTMGAMDPIRSVVDGKDAILSFFIKIYDEDSDQFVEGGIPMEFEFNLPEYFSRSSLNLYREEPSGTTTKIEGGLTKAESSIFTLTLNSNSVYTVSDSDSIIPSAGIGSDPHVTTIFGETYTMRRLSKYGNRLLLLKTPRGKITGHVTGLVNGEFLSDSEVSVGGKRALSVKFGSRGSKIRIHDPKLVREIGNVSIEVEKFRNTSRMNRVFLIQDLWEGGMYLFVNDEHRYVCPIFNRQPSESQRHLFEGLLAKPH